MYGFAGNAYHKLGYDFVLESLEQLKYNELESANYIDISDVVLVLLKQLQEKYNKETKWSWELLSAFVCGMFTALRNNLDFEHCKYVSDLIHTESLRLENSGEYLFSSTYMQHLHILYKDLFQNDIDFSMEH